MKRITVFAGVIAGASDGRTGLPLEFLSFSWSPLCLWGDNNAESMVGAEQLTPEEGTGLSPYKRGFSHV